MILFYLGLFIFITSAEKLENISEDEKLLRFRNLGYEERKAYEINKIETLLKYPDDNDIERPCQAYDKFCIRKFFAEHSRCKPVYGPVPDPLYRPQTTYYLPRINLTVVGTDVFYKGLNGRIEEFYINKKTDKLVLGVEYTGFVYQSNTTYYRFNKVGQEPFVNKDFAYINYRSIVQTIIIPNLKNLIFENSEVFTFTNDLFPLFILGPNAFSGNDPQVQATAVALAADVPTNTIEGFLQEATYYIQTRDLLLLSRQEHDPTDKAYIQQKCGLQLSSPEDENNIERPCQAYDTNCIRKFFVHNSHCSPRYGPAPNPIYRPQFTLYLPRVNLTLISLKLEYSGINGRIVEFYINRKTDRLVLGVDFDNFRFGSNENYFKFNRVGQEPIVNRDFFNVSYVSIGSTIVIPHLKDLQLQDSEVFSYSNSIVPPAFIVGPNTFAGTDPQLLLTAVGFLASLATNIQEGFLTESPFFISSFIQYNICDFGIRVY